MTDENGGTSATSPDRAPEGPGAILLAERESLGVTVREVSETLNLSMSVIEAIEANDYDRLPGTVFVRGYVRAYARLLELDPAPLMTRLPEAETADVYLPPEPNGTDWLREHPALVLAAAGGLLVLLLVVLVLSLWPSDGDEPEAGPAPIEEPQLGDPDARGAASAALALLEASAEAAPLAAAPHADELARAQASLDGARPALQAVGTGALSAADATDATVRITAGGDDRLTFGFTEDCWVDVKDANGDRLYSNISSGGSRLELIGEGPFRILLGYAPGAELAFNGEPVPLLPHTRNNVATLSLGQ